MAQKSMKKKVLESTKVSAQIPTNPLRVFARPGKGIVRGKPSRSTAEEVVKEAPGQFDYPVTLRGNTTHFNVYFDPDLGAGGETIANGVLQTCESEYNTISGFFGGITPPSFNIIIAPGIGGAYHYGCDATNLYCDAQTSPSVNVDHTRMLVVAEEVEVFSALQAGGWDCGASNGEGLSRVLANFLYPDQLNGFSTAAAWLDQGRPDYVNVNNPTDIDPISNGCSVLFLNYLHYQLGFGWDAIVGAAAPTLGETYSKLTGANDGLERFKALLQTQYPEGTPSGLTTDNPFPLPTVSIKPKAGVVQVHHVRINVGIDISISVETGKQS